MNVPIDIAEAGGETLRAYVKAIKEYEEIDLKRDKIDNSVHQSWEAISLLMEDYLILDKGRPVSYGDMYRESIGSRHPVKSVRDKNPILTIYEIEEHLKSLRHLLLDERETAIRTDELEKEILTIRKLN